MKFSTIALTGAAAVAGGTMIGVAPILSDRLVGPPAYAAAITQCRVTDGDTIRCGDERIRLLGIDAPELPGHCHGKRVCAPGDAYASTSSLEAAMSDDLHIERVGEDRYGRTLGLVTGPRGDLSCWQLAQKQAIYKPRWDNGYRVSHLCPSAAL